MSRRETTSQSVNRHPSSQSRQCELGNLLFDKARTVLHPEEIAARLKCTKALIIKLIEGGDLGAINIGSGKTKFYRIPAAEWERFLRKRATV